MAKSQPSRSPNKLTKIGPLLNDARVYLSGPMDFVASRAVEKATGWRSRVAGFLRELGVIVFDPWEKPDVQGLHEYGKEGETTTDVRSGWTFANNKEGAAAREQFAHDFWPALHVDLRMVDTSDFLVTYCPTNIYSVGTPHEIILARTQRKPVLFVSPRVRFDSLAALEKHFQEHGDDAGRRLLGRLREELPIKENESGCPSLWYTPLIGGEHFFDGFGFDAYRSQFPRWKKIPLDEYERRFPPQRPLLPFLHDLSHRLPQKWDRHKKDFGPNDDWILWNIQALEKGHAVGSERADTDACATAKSSTSRNRKT